MIKLSVLNPLTPYRAFTQFTPALPSFYWDVYSSEERIKKICLEIDKVTNYADYIADKVSDIEAVSPEEFEKYKIELDKRLSDLKKLINELNISDLNWDTQHGYLTSSIEAQRDLFNDLTVHSITVKQLNSLDITVDQLSDCGLNVRGLAVMSYWLVDKFDKLPEDFTNVVENNQKNKLTVYSLGKAQVSADGNVYIPDEFKAN